MPACLLEDLKLLKNIQPEPDRIAQNYTLYKFMLLSFCLLRIKIFYELDSLRWFLWHPMCNKLLCSMCMLRLHSPIKNSYIMFILNKVLRKLLDGWFHPTVMYTHICTTGIIIYEGILTTIGYMVGWEKHISKVRIWSNFNYIIEWVDWKERGVAWDFPILLFFAMRQNKTYCCLVL